MPLPPALAAKLSKRGIFQTPITKPEKERKRDFKGVIGCPNKNNVYHDCNHWCEAYWKPLNVPQSNYVRNVGKLLQKYPLPRHWTEVFDKGIKKYYYWDMENDIVSWLPPKHPRAFLSESAAKLRERRFKGEVVEERIIYKHEDKSERKRSSKNSRRDRDDNDLKKKHKYDDRFRRRLVDDIDPMDPASYSDVPIGTWSDGLKLHKATAENGLVSVPQKPTHIETSNKKSKKGVNFGTASYSS